MFAFILFVKLEHVSSSVKFYFLLLDDLFLFKLYENFKYQYFTFPTAPLCYIEHCIDQLVLF
jgi:hypothetical protein